jgi:D-alanyl-D-alanine carboxypeptidase
MAISSYRIPLLVMALLLASNAQATPTKSKQAAIRSAALVVDASSGQVLLEQDATHLWYPASLTKLMTLYLTFSAVDSGKLRFEDTLRASKHAAEQPETRIGLDAGDKMTVREAVLAVISQSANDAAVLLAERLAGSEESFAAQMTLKAHELGMRGTQFRNATGLPHNEQTTTARDMGLLALALIRDFPRHYGLFNTRSFSYRGLSYGNINGILASYPGADGLKTGFTCGSGYNLVASARHDQRRLIGVILGAGSGGERTDAMIKLLNKGFAAAEKASSGELVLAALESGDLGLESPPFRLKADECALGAGMRQGKRLPGWGLLFGAFQDQTQARKQAESMRVQLRNELKGGQVAVVRRQVEDNVTWKALLVDLKQVDAVNACLTLIKSGNVCLVQSPNVLNGGAGGALSTKTGKKMRQAASAPPPYF